MNRGFTLIELLVVIGIVAVLAVTILLTLNPAELLRQTRDAARVADITTLNKAIGAYKADLRSPAMGSSTQLYTSIPNTSSTCPELYALVPTASGYSYQCSTTSTLRNIDSTGWLPINFTAMSTGVPFTALPVDPTNAIGGDAVAKAYLYYTDGSDWVLWTVLETTKYRNSIGANDNGVSDAIYEIGSKISLLTLPLYGF